MSEYPPPSPIDQQASPQSEIRLSTKTVKPAATYTIIGITVLFFLLQSGSEIFLGNDWLFLLGGKINEFIVAGELWRLVTPVLLHGSIIHLLVNMYALFSLGSSLERHYGHVRFISLYLVGAFAGNVLSFAFSPNPSLGSSTAIFGLLAAEGVFVFQNRKFFGARAQSMLINILTIALVNFVFGLSVQRIDNFGHLGGMLGGLVFAWLAGPIWKVEGFYPALEITDERTRSQVWVASLVTVGFFGAIAMLKILNP